MNLPTLPQIRQAGRQCGPCSACCKTLPVLELGKPGATWCAQCQPGTGCRIHQDRPAVCRSFECAWLLGGMGLEDQDRPDRTGLVVCGRETVRGREGLIVWADSVRYLTSGRRLLERLAQWATSSGYPVFVYVPFRDTSGRLLTLEPGGRADLEPMPAGSFAPENPRARAPRPGSGGL